MQKILVIEDTPPVLDLVLSALQSEGFNTVRAEDGRIGVQLAFEHLPDLILCDVLMPGLDGYGVLNELRADATTAATPFIFLAAKTGKEDIRRGMELGADDYLTKPFTARELISAIKVRLERQAIISKKFEDLRCNISYALPHELRTPLNGIMGLSQLLSEPEISFGRDQITEMGQVIYGSSLRLEHLIENYLLYADLELMRAQPKKIRSLAEAPIIQPGTFIPDVAQTKAKQVGRETDLVLEIADGTVQMTPNYLKKIVEELVDNALKFSEAGTHVFVSMSFRDDDFILRVADNGRGMTAEQIANVGAFMQFGRELHEQQGSGLGLAIVRRLAELHGGQLSIESVANQETVAQVKLKRNVPLRHFSPTLYV